MTWSRKVFLDTDRIDGPGGSALHLVADHVSQALVVNGPEEDGGFQLLATGATVHALQPVEVEAPLHQHPPEVIDRRVLSRHQAQANHFPQFIHII